MTHVRAELLDDLQRFVSSHGIEVRTRRMEVEKPGEFDGPTVTLNPVHDREALSFYLAHAFGSIYQWSTDFEHARKVFDDLRTAKRGREKGDGNVFGSNQPKTFPSPFSRPLFEAALEAWRRFEDTSSDYAVGVLGDIGHAAAVRPYTVFFRADLEAMTIFHRSGKEPRWPDFFADWKRKVASGEVRIAPFEPKEVGPFKPVRIEKQEVVQERD